MYSSFQTMTITILLKSTIQTIETYKEFLSFILNFVLICHSTFY